MIIPCFGSSVGRCYVRIWNVGVQVAPSTSLVKWLVLLEASSIHGLAGRYGKQIIETSSPNTSIMTLGRHRVTSYSHKPKHIS